jgi:hypothetical protein
MYNYDGPCMDGLKNGRGKITKQGSSISGCSYECNFENGVETSLSKAGRSAERLPRRLDEFFENTARCKCLCNRFKLTRAGEDIDNLNNTVGGKGRKGNGHQK